MDLRETAIRLKKHGFEPKIFVPHWERWNIPGGRIDIDPGIPVEVLPIRSKQFNFRTLPRIFKSAVDSWKPDRIMIGNSFYLAPYIISQFPDKPVFLRIYAYEFVCPNYMNLSKCDVFNWYQENPFGHICPGNVFSTPWECWRCSLRRMACTLMGHRNPVAVEYWSSLAALPFFNNLIRKSLNSLQGILVYNPFIQNLLKPLKTKVHVVPAGIDTDRFTPRTNQRSGPIRILLTGRLDDQRKGYDSFRQCIRILSERRSDFEVWVTDPGSLSSDPGIHNAGWTSWNNLPDLYRSADIVICPSIWPEPFGITALEAMSSGLPVIASKIGGFEYSVVNGVTGLHFIPGDPNDMAEKIDLLISNQHLRERMGQAGRDRVVHHFRWDTIVDRYTAPILQGQSPDKGDWINQEPVMS